MKRTRKAFEYKQRDKSEVQKRANQSGGLYDSYIRQDIQMWKPKEGVNRIRFLPPTWDDPEHYGIDAYVHFGVGSDSQAYLCLAKMKNEVCPVCEERRRAQKAGDEVYAKELSPSKRVLAWIIDRSDEASGPQIYSMAWSHDAEIAERSIKKQKGEVLYIDHPDDGYDVEFTRKGTGLKTKYSAVEIDRDSSPLSENEDQAAAWLEFVQENPLPDCLVYFDAEYIADVAAGKAKKDKDEDEEEEEEDRPTRSGSKSASGKSRQQIDDDEEEEEDDEDDDDEEKPRRPVNAKAAAKPKPKAEEEDDEDDEDDEEEDDEEEEEYDCPACQDTGKNSKGGPCVCAKGKKLKAKPKVEDDDDDDDDDEEDEEEEKPRRPAKRN